VLQPEQTSRATTSNSGSTQGPTIHQRLFEGTVAVEGGDCKAGDSGGSDKLSTPRWAASDLEDRAMMSEPRPSSVGMELFGRGATISAR
jgi:hypothetical protein